MFAKAKFERVRRQIPPSYRIALRLGLLIAALLAPLRVSGQLPQAPEWEAQVRKYAEARDWTAALKIVDSEVALAPLDMDTRAWRARVLAWSGDLTRSEKEYLAIVKVVQ